MLRDLGVARKAFAGSDRDLHVLQALLSFLPASVLAADAPLIVFPSNARLSERLHGMPESTLRRHLAALVSARLILRHDSPNGKRFARRDTTGGIARAFGFDLRPLLVRTEEITTAAQHARAEAEELHLLREAAVLHLRDAAQLPDHGERTLAVLALQRHLRRKLSLNDMRELTAEAAHLAHQALAELPAPAEHPGANDSQIERHIQDSNKTLSESEPCVETGETPTLCLDTILSACPESADYAQAPITTWRGMQDTARRLCPMMGITPEVWHQAEQHMGPSQAATAVLCILQRFGRIQRPGAYLRTLVSKARNGGFDVNAMVRALLANPRAVPS